MTNPELSNEVSNKQVILWQYDQAPNLLALIDGFNQIATDTVTQFWDYFRDGVFNIMTADTFGLNVLGRLMGLPRPTVLLPGGDSSESESEEGYWGLTFTAEEPNSTVAMAKVGDAPAVSLETSVDCGLTWQPFIIGETVITLANVGDSVCFQAGDGGTGGDGLNMTMANPVRFGFHAFSMTGQIAASGDMSSLLDRYSPVNDLSQRSRCFQSLFDRCSSLTSAPDITATTLSPNCYSYLFYACTRLKRVKVGFGNWFSELRPTEAWLYNVSANGTFECPSALDTSTRDVDHIPEGWTVVNSALSAAPLSAPAASPDGQSTLDQLTPSPIRDDFFRRLLLGRFFLFGMSPTVPNYNKYLNIIYGRFSADILPIVYTSDELKAAAASKASEGDSTDSSEEVDDGTRTITEIAHLAIVETPASDGDSSDSSDDTPATLAVYDARSNYFLFTMTETEPGKFVFSAPNHAKGFSITFGGKPPTIGTFPATVNKAHVADGLDMSMSFVPSLDGQAQLDQEEFAMHAQHPDLIYIYPAGIRTNEPSASSNMVIGTEDQPLENFADAFSWVQKPTAAGGILAGNEKAKFLDGVIEDGNEGGDGNG